MREKERERERRREGEGEWCLPNPHSSSSQKAMLNPTPQISGWGRDHSRYSSFNRTLNFEFRVPSSLLDMVFPGDLERSFEVRGSKTVARARGLERDIWFRVPCILRRERGHSPFEGPLVDSDSQVVNIELSLSADFRLLTFGFKCLPTRTGRWTRIGCS